MEMRQVACILAVILAVAATVSCSSKKSGDLLKRLDDLQMEIDTIKRELSLDDEAVDAESSVSKRLAKWRDPKRPMLHSMDNYLKKKSLSEDEELANEKSDALMRLMVRALLDEKRK